MHTARISGWRRRLAVLCTLLALGACAGALALALGGARPAAASQAGDPGRVFDCDGNGTATPTLTATATSLPATATGTATAVPSSATPTATPAWTNTPANTATLTAVPPSSTRTAVPPSATTTSTPSSTRTAVLPSATTTSTPSGTPTAVPPSATTTSTPSGTPTAVLPSTATRTAVPLTGTPLASATITRTPTGTPPPSATGTLPPSATPLPSSTPPPTATRTGVPATSTPLPTVTSVLPTGTPPPPSATRPPPSATPQATGTPPSPSATPAPGTPTTTPCGTTFNDVHPADYFYTPVLYLACHGVVSGYSDGSFRPYSTTTRAQMVKIVVLGFGLPIVTPAAGQYTFTDVPPGFPFFAVIETAAANDIVSGYVCGGPGEPCDAQRRPYFRPYASVTRGQLSKITVIAARWILLDPPGPGRFTDVVPNSAFYPFVETAACHGIISGYTCGGLGEPCDPSGRPYFRQYTSATRGQIAKIVYLGLTGAGTCPPSTAAPR